jgi:hypothetical protein
VTEEEGGVTLQNVELASQLKIFNMMEKFTQQIVKIKEMNELLCDFL